MPAANRNGHEEYLQTHLPGKTFFFDIDSIVDTNSALPHTFPPITKFQEYVREVQLPSDSEVVVYDSNGMFSAARCWYIFKYFGHTNVRMLDGGLPKWIAENKPTVSGNQLPMDTGASKGTLFEATPSGNSVVSLTEMDPDNVDCDFAILDARSSERFLEKFLSLDQAYGQVTFQGLQTFHLLIYCVKTKTLCCLKKMKNCLSLSAR